MRDVGSDPENHFLIGAVCILVRRDDTVLSLLRSRHKDASPGTWEAVSGRLRPGESPRDAALREVTEESGLVIDLDPRPLEAHAASRAGHPMLIVYFAARWRDGEVRLSDEHEEFAWLDAQEFGRRCPVPELAGAVQRLLSQPG